MDLISVIVPIYKVEQYLDRCVKSIAEQTYANLEIILVDDGSPDRCPAMCDAWAERDPRIKVIHKENGGLSDARNAGLEIATGEYISFIDSDDWVSPNFLEFLYHALCSTDSDIAACDVRTVEDSEVLPACSLDATVRLCTPEQAIGDIVSGIGFRAVAWNKLYKRQFWENIRYPVGRHHEDEFVTYRVLGAAKRLVFVETALYYYFLRQGSIMNSVSAKRLDALDAYLERLEYLNARFPALYAKDKINYCFSCVSFYRQLDHLQRQEAVQCRTRISDLRKCIRFSLQELGQCNPKQLAYVLGSRYCIGLLSRLLNLNQLRKDT